MYPIVAEGLPLWVEASESRGVLIPGVYASLSSRRWGDFDPWCCFKFVKPKGSQNHLCDSIVMWPNIVLVHRNIKQKQNFNWSTDLRLILTLGIVAVISMFNKSALVSGNVLKLHTIIWKHKRRSLPKAHSSNMDFDRIMAPFGLWNFFTLSKFLFYYQGMGIVKYAVLLAVLVDL
jgi:hypothetical protein